jgi:hypothetical protein
MTRICLLVNQLGLGGAEKQVVLLAEGLRERGHEVTVAVLLGGGGGMPGLGPGEPHRRHVVDRHVALYRALLGTRAGSSRRTSQRAPSGVK